MERKVVALPFGLRSAPKIFNAVADGRQWILARNEVDNCLHYLDNFLILSSGVSNECGVALQRELLSLIGQLQHACCVVRPGRSFLRRMIALSTMPKELYHWVRLSKEFRSDLRWWGTLQSGMVLVCCPQWCVPPH